MSYCGCNGNCNCFNSTVDSLKSSDQFTIKSSQNGDCRNSSINTLQEYMQSNLQFSSTFGVFTTLYSSPSSSGFSVDITPSVGNVHLILTPTATFADGTIVLPEKSTVLDKQEVLVNCTQIVTTLTISGNGSTVTGSPVTLSANDFFRLKYDSPNSVWYRVG